MQPLERSLRRDLEKTIIEARDIAENAAKAALEQLGVGESSPYSHLSPAERELRRKLRIHGRQLGDVRDPKTESQEIDRLIEEVAYEHWHRMLFARFLAENDLLMLPDGSVSISLKECEDLAVEEGARNGWELASRYAAKMLPQIFRPDSPVFELILPPENEHDLERKITELPSEVFKASDSLGWVYQFWQAKRKVEVNKSGVKIGARELPSQTQIFTEPYMVQFLIDNSLGAWWAARRLSDIDLKTATSEIELQEKAALPGVPLTYLRFVQDESKRWSPAAGTFDAWPEHLKDFKVLDPCCGSGHFLVAALLMLVPIRMEREGLTVNEAVDLVISENLHGLEIDQRCVELAAFAVALTAWNYPNAGGYRQIPGLAIACSGLAITAKKDEWIALANGDKDLEYTLDSLYDQFSQAPVLGSLIDPIVFGEGHIIIKQWETLEPLLKKALSGSDVERLEMGVVAQGLARSANILSGKYHWIVTNVPYLARGNQGDTLQKFCKKNYNDAKSDIATVFLDRCIRLCDHGGVESIVLPQNWLFLTTYSNLRTRLLKNETWHIIVRLGPKAFETISGEVVKALLLIIQHECPVQGLFRGIDVSEARTASDKSVSLVYREIKELSQKKQLDNPDAIVILDDINDSSDLMRSFSYCYQGTSTGDKPRFIRYHWEIQRFDNKWFVLESVPETTSEFSGKSDVVNWNSVQSFCGSAIRGNEAFKKKGIAIGQVSTLPATLYLGNIFPDTTPVIIPIKPEMILPLWCFCSSSQFYLQLRKVNQKLSINNGYIGKIPFNYDYWTKVAAEKYPHGLPKPYSDDPTQWIFHGHPVKSDSPLQVAVARLLGYHWPAELDPEMELSEEQSAWVQKCETLYQFEDDDGIVCIPSIRGEPTAADRLLSLLAAAYGDKWSNDVLSQLLVDADHEGKTLETWLRDKFFSQHCKLFQNRPFIWQIWDSLRDGFSVLVNYHKLDHKKLESLIYTYLGDWINRQKHDVVQGIDGAQEKLDAAEILKKRLELILQGEAPYDIFVRWKPIEQQPIGWNPDLNDGIRLNIRPFMSVPDVGKKGAGVLREKPNIKWDKDRGGDVESAPWYHLFKGDRINDHHLALAEKNAAREAHKRESGT